MMMWTDFHIHSNFSDGAMSIAEIVDFYGERGYGAIAVTDHLCEEKSFLGRSARFLEKTLTRDSFPMYLETLKHEGARAMDQYGMLVIPGVEITKNSLFNHRSSHMLFLGVEKWISADDDILSILKSARAENLLSIAAHPVHTGVWEPQTFHLWHRREELRSYFDAWEVASGAQLFHEVREARLPMIANSDLHLPQQIQSWKTLLNCERREDAIFESIRKQQLDFKFHKEIASTKPRLANCYTHISVS